ncbi:MAG: type IV pilin N-terminal domain-containing protein [Thermoplasmata archaeon]
MTLDRLKIRSGRSRWRRGPQRRARAVAEVIGTILILALTVVLFSAIFFFVNTFPRPPTQTSNQFASQVIYGTSGGRLTIAGLRILHLTGPDVFTNPTQIYIFAQVPYTALCPAAGCTVAQGLPGNVQVWTLGQTWNVTFGVAIYAPNNVTVTIISSSVLLYSQDVPGITNNYPPIFLGAWTSTTNACASAVPVASTQFYICSQVQDSNINPGTPRCAAYCMATLAKSLPGANATGLLPMTYNAVTKVWFATVPATWVTVAGTYQVLIVATDILGLQNIYSLTFTIT